MKRLVFFLSLIFSIPVSADESPWVQHLDMAESRIIYAKAIADNDGNGWFAWELRLKPGWKVYWRSPGEAGLPPKLLLNEGSSVTSITPHFPLPKRFELFGLQTFGYGIQFILPFKAEGNKPNSPVTLDMKVDFMICKDICIPFVADYKLVQSGENHPHAELYDATISLWRSKVPDTSGEAIAGLKVNNVSVKGTKGHQNIVFEVEADQNLSNADILIETDEVFSLGKPKITLKGRGNKAILVVSVDGGKKMVDIKGKSAKLTFTDGRGHAIERKITF